MYVRIAVPFLIVVLVGSTSAATEEPIFGVAQPEANGRICVTLEGSELSPSDEVSVVYFDSRRILTARLLGPGTSFAPGSQSSASGRIMLFFLKTPQETLPSPQLPFCRPRLS